MFSLYEVRTEEGAYYSGARWDLCDAANVLLAHDTHNILRHNSVVHFICFLFFIFSRTTHTARLDVHSSPCWETFVFSF